MDIHVETSTVREAFEFSALLRQSATTSKSDKLATVDEVLDILQMSDLQNVVIQSLSLEQKKRTTIGVELCAKPSLLLFLDEPTSVSFIADLQISCGRELTISLGFGWARRHEHCQTPSTARGQWAVHHLHHSPSEPRAIRASKLRKIRLGSLLQFLTACKV